MSAVAETTPGQEAAPVRNEVILWGRLAAPAEERVLPSGDAIVTLRVVIPRRGTRLEGARAERKGQVDTIDVVCWTKSTRRTALRLQPGATVEVEGALRRRFFGGAAGRQSRYEVEAGRLRRLAGTRSADT